MPTGQMHLLHFPPTRKIISECKNLKTAPLRGLSLVLIVIFQQSKLFKTLLFQLLLMNSFLLTCSVDTTVENTDFSDTLRRLPLELLMSNN